MRLINTTSVETQYGYRAFNLFEGNLAEVDAGLLVASAALGGEHLTGRVLDALRSRWTLPLQDFEPLLHGPIVRTLIPSEKTPVRLLVVRMPGVKWLATQGLEPLAAYQAAVRACFASVAALEMLGELHERVSLPLLGGSRGYEPRKAMEAILVAAREFLEASRATRRVDLVLADPFAVQSWSEGMNEALGRAVIESARDEVSEGLAAEIVEMLTTAPSIRHVDLEGAVEPVLRSLKSTPLCLEMVASCARIFMERVVRRVVLDCGLEWRGSLLADIDRLRGTGRVAPWMASYFHSLRVLGNETIHARDEAGHCPTALTGKDLVVLLSSLQRVVAFWVEWTNGPPRGTTSAG